MKQTLLNIAAALCIMCSLGQQYARADNCDQALRPAAYIVVQDQGDGSTDTPDDQMKDPVWDFLIDKMWWGGCSSPGPDLNYLDQSPETYLAPPLMEDQDA